MNIKRALSLDMICWVALLIAVWMGPQWVIKVALSIMIVWNGLCINWLAKNMCGKVIPLSMEECLNNECNCNTNAN